MAGPLAIATFTVDALSNCSSDRSSTLGTSWSIIAAPRSFAASKPDARLIKLLLKARRFNATLVGSDDVPFTALAEREGVSPSYFTRLVRLSYLAPDITHAILDGRQPRDLTADKLLEHSRLPLAWHDQRTAFGPSPRSSPAASGPREVAVQRVVEVSPEPVLRRVPRLAWVSAAAACNRAPDEQGP